MTNHLSFDTKILQKLRVPKTQFHLQKRRPRDRSSSCLLLNLKLITARNMVRLTTVLARVKTSKDRGGDGEQISHYRASLLYLSFPIYPTSAIVNELQPVFSPDLILHNIAHIELQPSFTLHMFVCNILHAMHRYLFPPLTLLFEIIGRFSITFTTNGKRQK